MKEKEIYQFIVGAGQSAPEGDSFCLSSLLGEKLNESHTHNKLTYYSVEIQELQIPPSAKKILQYFFQAELAGKKTFTKKQLCKELSLSYITVNRSLEYLTDEKFCSFKKNGHKFIAKILFKFDRTWVVEVLPENASQPISDAQKILLAQSLEANKESVTSDYFKVEDNQIFGLQKTMASIAQENGISKRTAQRMVKDLSKKGLLLIETKFDMEKPVKERQQASTYSVNIKKVFRAQFAESYKSEICREKYGKGSKLTIASGDYQVDRLIQREAFLWKKAAFQRRGYYDVRSFASVYNHLARKAQRQEDNEYHLAMIAQHEEIEEWNRQAWAA